MAVSSKDIEILWKRYTGEASKRAMHSSNWGIASIAWPEYVLVIVYCGVGEL